LVTGTSVGNSQERQPNYLHELYNILRNKKNQSHKNVIFNYSKQLAFMLLHASATYCSHHQGATLL